MSSIPAGDRAPRTWRDVGRDYLVLTKPWIMLLLLITTVPAMVLANGGWPGWSIVIATLIGGVLASGGAGAVNMYIDRDIDGLMARTRNRPIPRGTVSPRAAAIFGWTLGLASGPWLYLTVNALAAVLALTAFLFYVGPYSLYLKRRTLHNTLETRGWLGFVGRGANQALQVVINELLGASAQLINAHVAGFHHRNRIRVIAQREQQMLKRRVLVVTF